MVGSLPGRGVNQPVPSGGEGAVLVVADTAPRLPRTPPPLLHRRPPPARSPPACTNPPARTRAAACPRAPAPSAVMSAMPPGAESRLVWQAMRLTRRPIELLTIRSRRTGLDQGAEPREQQRVMSQHRVAYGPRNGFGKRRSARRAAQYAPHRGAGVPTRSEASSRGFCQRAGRQLLEGGFQAAISMPATYTALRGVAAPSSQALPSA